MEEILKEYAVSFLIVTVAVTFSVLSLVYAYYRFTSPGFGSAVADIAGTIAVGGSIVMVLLRILRSKNPRSESGEAK